MEAFQQMEHSPYLNFPIQVAMETYTKCNASCSFCTYPTLERIDNKMPDNLIEKIIGDLEVIPKQVPFRIVPYKVSEPFLDVRLFDILETCNERLPNANLRIFSNGSAITEKHLKSLSKLKNLDHLWISLNHYQAKPYEALMNLPFKRTLDRIDTIHRKKAAGEVSFEVVISRVCDYTDADLGFKMWAEERYPLFELHLIKPESWLGDIKSPGVSLEVPQTRCLRWYELSITSTGVVSLCCMDGQAAYPIGDVSKQHVLEVYNDPAFRKMREREADRTAYFPCNTCSYWFFNA